MRRDWWKIRQILLAREPYREDDAVMAYHVDLCRQAGFVRDEELTWEGQDAAALLENAEALREVLAELEPVGAPWEILREKLIRLRWPKQEPRWPEQPEPKVHVPQTKRCPLCLGHGHDPVFGASGTAIGAREDSCPVCHGARVIKE